MEKNIKIKILRSIGSVYEQSKDSKLKNSFFKKIEDELILLSEYFKTTKSQSLFVAMVFSLNYKGDTVDLNDLIEYFDCNPMKLLEFNNDFESLLSQGIFTKENSKHRMKVAIANDQYSVNRIITEAVLKNEPLPDINNEQINDVISMLEELYNIGEQRDNDNISTF